MTNFINDNSEFICRDMNEMAQFLEARESGSIWYTDETNTKATDIRFKPIFTEPLCVPAEVKNLQSAAYPKFSASEDAYKDSMDCPDMGCCGTTQLMTVNGTLWPVGSSAVRSVLERAGIKPEGWEKLKKFNPASLSEALNLFLEATKGNVCVLIQDEKVRAVNSGRYAICPSTYVMDATKKWIADERPKAKFMSGYVNHDFTNWNVDLSAYTNEILGKFPALATSGFAPALQIYLSHTGASSVSLKPCLMRNGLVIPMSEGIDCPHIKKGTASERTLLMQRAVEENFKLVFQALETAAQNAEKLDSIQIHNPYNAVLRVMKYIAMPKSQGMEAADQFGKINPGMATAYECFLCLFDAFVYVMRDYPKDQRKQCAVAESIGRAIRLKWTDYDVPGSFSW